MSDRPTDAEAAAVYSAAIRRAQAILSEWVVDHDNRIAAQDVGNALLGIFDHRDLVGFMYRRGEGLDQVGDV